MSDFIKKAYEANRVKNVEEAFKEYPPEEEWHHGDIEYFINDPNYFYGDTCKIGDIVFVREYNYPNGTKGHNHLFVIVDDNYQAVPIEYFGMIISSKIDKLKYDTNVLLLKDSLNNLNKDSIIKVDAIYKILKKQIVFKLGCIDLDKVDEYKEPFNKLMEKQRRG